MEKNEIKRFCGDILQKIKGPQYKMSDGHFEAWFRALDKDQSGDIAKDEMINLIKKIGKFGQVYNQKKKLSALTRSVSVKKGHKSSTALSLLR